MKFLAVIGFLLLVAAALAAITTFYALLSWAIQGIIGAYTLTFWQHVGIGAIAALLTGGGGKAASK